MKITVTERIEIDGNVEEYSACVDDESYTPEPEGERAREIAKELFKSLP